ncbi:mediator of RNA polymerase II transcription subunit 8 isoform X1 [Tanacetum coccineum]|uniref:Mediator of RNA polymerase II transcription subunit 8 isoform X1 n=1 Tax=Tanacetum coccineum TaxID=301880 RepID=A0ABQ5AHX9_9ASTR
MDFAEVPSQQSSKHIPGSILKNAVGTPVDKWLRMTTKPPLRAHRQCKTPSSPTEPEKLDWDADVWCGVAAAAVWCGSGGGSVAGWVAGGVMVAGMAMDNGFRDDYAIVALEMTVSKLQDVLGQFSMVNLELYNIVEDIKKVSKAFVVHPKNVNGENAAILPVMISSKLLPEIEADDTSKREQLLYAMQNLSVPSQIEKLKARIDMIGAACESAEKVIADTRKTYFGTRQGPTNIMTLDKAQAAKIQEQENLLRHAVNHGQGLRLPPDQRQITSALPAHLVDVLPVGDNAQTVSESSGWSVSIKRMYMKNTPPMVTNAVNNQGALMQGSGSQLMGRAAASPGGTGTQSFDNTTASPLPYANSPRSAANMMNTPSPQQQQTQQQQQQQQQFQQQQRQRLMQLPQHQQQLLAQQLRQNPMAGLAQNQMSQLHDLQGQGQQKYQLHGQNQMQFSQSLGAQQFQGRQLPSGGMQHGIAQSQLNQGSQLNRINQMSSAANSALFNAAQGTPNNQMMSNMSAMMPSQPLVPRMQFGLSGGNRTLGSQNMSDQGSYPICRVHINTPTPKIKTTLVIKVLLQPFTPVILGVPLSFDVLLPHVGIRPLKC